MFFESRTKGFDPTFTLKEQDHEYEGVHYISMRKIYIGMEDPTEYLFATEVLGSWDHWLKLCNSALIREHIDKWRIELEIKLRAKAISAMVDTATTAGAKGTTAAKWIASGGWKEGKGRPSKDAIKRELKIATKLDEETESHLKLLEDHQKNK
jgi:hypothetical protein